MSDVRTPLGSERRMNQVSLNLETRQLQEWAHQALKAYVPSQLELTSSESRMRFAI